MENKNSIIQNIEELEIVLQNVEVDFGGILDAIKSIFNKSDEAADLLTAQSLADKLQEISKKLYLSYIHSEDTYKEVLLENIYSTKYEKNALIIYIIYPFLFPRASCGHTNQAEVKVMADVLKQRGYNIDVINVRYQGEINFAKYQMVIGYGRRFDECCYYDVDKNIRKICYLTESSPYFSNYAELKRLRYFQKRNGFFPSLERQSKNFLDLNALRLADAAICIGNVHTAQTYEGMFEKIYPIKATGFMECDLKGLVKSQEKNRNFLWYGGAGPVHKGLDLCIEAFRKLPELTLYIVGEPTAEIYNFYKKDIEEAENILYYGFLNKDSEEFKFVCESCGFCISPSCSEGQSTSVITTMFAGIIPVCTKETGLDMEEIGGILIEDITLESLVNQIKSISQMDYEEIDRRQSQVYEYVINNHTLDHYRQNLDDIIGRIIE